MTVDLLLQLVEIAKHVVEDRATVACVPPRANLPRLSEPLVDLARRHAGVLTTAEALAAGLTKPQIDALVRHGAWRRVVRGAYVLAEAIPDDGDVAPLQQAWAAVLLAGPPAVVSGGLGWTLHRLDGAEWPITPEVVMPPGANRHHAEGRRIVFRDVPYEDIWRLGELGVLSIERLIIDASRSATREVFVSMLDSALHNRRVSRADLERLGPCVAERARAWVDLADGRAESPLETRLRLIAIDAGMPPDDLNHEVKEGKRVVARIDLVWFRAAIKLAVECDGKGPHSLPDPLFKDRARQAALTARGWVVLRFLWGDVVGRPDWVLEQIRQHLYSVAV